MRRWLRDRWREWLASYDADEALEGSSPIGALVAGGGMVGVLAAIAYLPSLAEASDFRHAPVAMAMAVTAGLLTLLAWKHRCRGTIGGVATLADNVFYSGAMTFAAVHTSWGFGVGIAIAHALMLLFFQSRMYGLTLVWAIALALPLVFLVVFRAYPAVVVILVSTYPLALGMSQMTGRRRQMLNRQRRLEQALGATDQMAEASLQAALATRLLTLGHFLHELRNKQTAVANGLTILDLEAQLSGEARRALELVQEAQLAEQQLVLGVVSELKKRSDANATFSVREVLADVARAAEGIVVHDELGQLDVELSGTANHLLIVLDNLVRNAAQAGARNVHVQARPEPGSVSVELLVHDDGPGIPPDHRDTLFRAFATTRTDGTGLGLYLCRRHVELLGGTIAADFGPLGGAAFIIRLPLAREGSTTEPGAASPERDSSVPVPV